MIPAARTRVKVFADMRSNVFNSVLAGAIKPGGDGRQWNAVAVQQDDVMHEAADADGVNRFAAVRKIQLPDGLFELVNDRGESKCRRWSPAAF